MLILLPLSFFAVAFIGLLGHSSRASEEPTDWRTSFLKAALIWGLVVALSSEALTLVSGINKFWLSVLWGTALTVAIWWGLQNSRLRLGWENGLARLRSLGRFEWAIVAGIGVIAASVLVVGWLSPPNNVDGHLYHMTRIMHWAQNQSLEHYASKYDLQLNRPPWAGTAILHLRLLWGDDRPASLVQWFSMLGAIVATTGIAARLGAGRIGQWATAAFVATIPMGILQASSTQVDYVTAFWLVAGLYFVVWGLEGKSSYRTDLWVGAAAGLCLLSKATGYVYMLPVVAAYLLFQLKRPLRRRVLVSAALVGLAVVLLNMGYWSRNLETYGSPLGGLRSFKNWLPNFRSLAEGSGALFDLGLVGGIRRELESEGSLTGFSSPSLSTPSPAEVLEGEGEAVCCAEVANGKSGAQSGLESLLRWPMSRLKDIISGMLIHSVTPSSLVNSWIEDGLLKVSWMLSQRLFEERSKIAWNHEDTAVNPIHLSLSALTVVAVLVLAMGRQLEGAVLAYGAIVWSGFIILNSLGFNVWILRYQLGFFVAVAPLFGVAFERTIPKATQMPVLGLLLVTSIPWLLLNNTRPLVGMEPWPTRIGSVLKERPERILFAISQNLIPDAVAASREIEASGCGRIGLWMDSSDLEYPIWWLLDAPQDGTQIRILRPLPSTSHLIMEDFQPCLVVCTQCRGRESAFGLPLLADHGHYRIYSGADGRSG